MAKTTALLLSLTAFVTTFAAVDLVQKTNAVQTTYAQTATQYAANETTLIAPDSYQQYLSLTNPMDVALTDDYMAIADNNLIYVYDVQKDEYRKYEHTRNQDPTKDNIMELQFYGDDQLYFLDGRYLYLLDPETMQASYVSITDGHPFYCSSFLLVDGILYYTDVKAQPSVSYISLNGAKAATLATVDGNPTIAFWNGELYYTDAGNHLYKIDPKVGGKGDPIAFFQDDLVSMQIQDNLLLCSTLSGDFYAYNLAEIASVHNAAEVTPLAHYQGSYAALSLLGDYAYVVNGTSLCQYALKASSFTEFEICNTSDSVHRFNGATETLLLNDQLFIADNGNKRISVYDVKNDKFSQPIKTTFSPKYLAGDENTLLAADNTQAVLYNLTKENYGQVLATFNKFNGSLIGAVNVYGKYYFTTDENYYYAATAAANENGETVWSIRESKKSSTRRAKLLTTDAYGYLYVAGGNNAYNVYRFSEESFLKPEDLDGEQLPNVTLSTDTEKFMIDYDGGVYALVDGKLQKNTQTKPYALNAPLVYSETATIRSFAFGIEDNVAYVLYDENYLVKTTLLDLPTVKNIPVNNVDADIFNNQPTTAELVRLRERAMLIDFNLAELTGANVFPYLNYSRHETTLTALKIGTTANGKHTILVFYDTDARAYRSCLALTSDCFDLTDEEKEIYCKTYSQPKIMYTSNQIPVYKFPHLSGLPTVTTLARNTKIETLGEINNLDYSYYLVRYTDEQNVSHTGYVPKAFVLEFNPTPSTPETETYGATESDNDATRKLVALLLGSAAILILTDVLIFRAMRKKKDD